MSEEKQFWDVDIQMATGAIICQGKIPTVALNAINNAVFHGRQFEVFDGHSTYTISGEHVAFVRHREHKEMGL